MERKWSARVYREGDEDQLFELDNIVHGREIHKKNWIEGWQWAHLKNPAGTSMIWLAEQDGKIVGVHLLVMINMKIGRETIKGGEPIDTMTHPEYRRQGISSILGRKLLNEAGKKGVCLEFAFPNPHHYPIRKKSGWFDVCACHIMIKPLNLENTLKRRIKNKFLRKIGVVIGATILNICYRTKKYPEVDGLTITKIQSFDGRINDFWKNISNDHEIIVVRDKEYLNWRYVNVPNMNYVIYLAEEGKRICGYIVLKCVKEHDQLLFGYIIDIIAPLDRSEVIHSLLSKAIEHFEGENVDCIISTMVADKIYRKTFLKSGFINYFLCKSYRLVAYTTCSNYPHEFLEKPDNWFIQYGDLPYIY